MSRDGSFQTIRNDFPFILECEKKGLVYLDSAATSQKPECVIASIADFYRTSNVNVHRGSFELAQRLADRFDMVRSKVGELVGGGPQYSVVFVKSATEASNIVAYGLSRSYLKKGDVILTTEMEHHANLLPWYRAAQDSGAKVVSVPQERFLENLTTDVKVVAFTHCSNVLGTITDARAWCEAARKVGAISFIDGAQAVPHLEVSLKDIGCDFYSFSAHKMCGPTGIGVLVGLNSRLDALPPFILGGSMVNEVKEGSVTWKGVPDRFEGGTPPLAEVIGLGEAAKYLMDIGMKRIREHEMSLTGRLIEGLSEIKDIDVYGPKELTQRSGVVSFNLQGVHPHDVAFLLDKEGFMVRDGSSCAQPLMHSMCVPGVVRASPYLYNTEAEVVNFVAAVKKVREFFK